MTRYPAIFVNDILVATPDDFGFYGKGGAPEGGRYAPLKSAAAHERFRADLTRMIELLLAGRGEDARAAASPARPGEIARFPDVTLPTLDGRRITRAELAGKVVIVELWATWCPPCRGSLAWLGGVRKKYGNRIEVVAISVESPEANVRRVARELNHPFAWVLGTPEIARSFGDVRAVPTLLLFDGEGKTSAVFYGAPPTLHAEAEEKLAGLLGRPSARPGS